MVLTFGGRLQEGREVVVEVRDVWMLFVDDLRHQMEQSSPDVVGFGALELRKSIEKIAIYWSVKRVVETSLINLLWVEIGCQSRWILRDWKSPSS